MAAIITPLLSLVETCSPFWPVHGAAPLAAALWAVVKRERPAAEIDFREEPGVL
jgi:hypothetical protein